MAEIVWTLEAARCLEDIRDYIAADNPTAAHKVVSSSSKVTTEKECEPLPRTYSTLLVLSFLICMYAWMTELTLIVCRLIVGKLPGDNPVAHCVLLAVAVGSSIFIHVTGRKQFERAAGLGFNIPLTCAQSILVTFLVIAYPVFVMWTLGAFDK